VRGASATPDAAMNIGQPRPVEKKSVQLDKKRREPDAPAPKSTELMAGRSRSAPFPFPRRHPRSLHC